MKNEEKNLSSYSSDFPLDGQNGATQQTRESMFPSDPEIDAPGELLNKALDELSTALQHAMNADEQLRRSSEAASRGESGYQTELAIANAAIEHERRYYHELFHFAPDGLIITDLQGIILEANQAAAFLLRGPTEFLKGKPLAVFVPRSRRQEFRSRLAQVLHANDAHWRHDWEMELQPRIGGSLHAAMTIGPVHDADRTVTSLRWFIQDISESHKALDALREREALIRAILETTVDGFATFDENGLIEIFNPAAERIFGYSAKQVVGKNIETLMTLPRREQHGCGPLVDYLRNDVRKIIGIISEVTGRRKDGSTFPLDLAITKIAFAGRQRFIATVRDITERKRAEESMSQSREQMRNLAGRLRTVREEERARIGRDIHDQLGQVLTGLRMELTWVQRKLTKRQTQLVEKTEEMAKQIDDVIRAVGKIATELRPIILDHVGVGAAIEWQAREFQNQTGIRCRMIASLPDLQLDNECETALFRIFQESLTNVARHAVAKRVDVALQASNGEVRLEVKDNGRGIREEEIGAHHSLGLLSMRERALALDGSVTVSGKPGKGSVVIARIPIRERGSA